MKRPHLLLRVLRAHSFVKKYYYYTIVSISFSIDCDFVVFCEDGHVVLRTRIKSKYRFALIREAVVRCIQMSAGRLVTSASSSSSGFIKLFRLLATNGKCERIRNVKKWMNTIRGFVVVVDHFQ